MAEERRPEKIKTARYASVVINTGRQVDSRTPEHSAYRHAQVDIQRGIQSAGFTATPSGATNDSYNSNILYA